MKLYGKDSIVRDKEFCLDILDEVLRDHNIHRAVALIIENDFLYRIWERENEGDCESD